MTAGVYMTADVYMTPYMTPKEAPFQLDAFSSNRPIFSFTSRIFFFIRFDVPTTASRFSTTNPRNPGK
jgi:hypothetical protein